MTVPAKRDLISIDDLSSAEILELFEHADAFGADLNSWSHVCRGTILAALFFEPSTRTRLSFESAMLRLGGGVITVPEGSSSSRAKGETLADTVRVVGGGYADLLVLRHPEDGSARVAGRYAGVPVINGGDGAHEHPTQTLCDLYTLWRERGRLEGLDVVLCGDLRYSRTIHSFAYALGRFRANIITIPYPGFEMPQYVLQRLSRDFGVKATSASMGDLQDIAGGQDSAAAAAYLTASRPHQQALFTELTERHIDRIDAIYMTRAQRERHVGGETPGDYPRLSGESLRAEMFRDTRVMHPLPRLDEIDPALDGDPRAVYFRQAELGVPIRMALMAFLLGKIQLRSAPPEPPADPVYSGQGGFVCRNERCITSGEGRRYLAPEFSVLNPREPLLTCVYCGKDARPGVVGDRSRMVFGPAGSAWAAGIGHQEIVYFASDEQARVAGFLPENPA